MVDEEGWPGTLLKHESLNLDNRHQNPLRRPRRSFQADLPGTGPLLACMVGTRIIQEPFHLQMPFRAWPTAFAGREYLSGPLEMRAQGRWSTYPSR